MKTLQDYLFLCRFSVLMYRKVPFSEKMKGAALIVVAGSTGFGLLQAYNGNERFYKDIIMPLVHVLPPETAHKFAVKMAKHNLINKPKLISDGDMLKSSVMGLSFSNPIGLAAGFDKDAEAVSGLSKAGFGFVEVGTVTPLPQPGNDKPRVFRYPHEKAIVNRLGFNSVGHGSVMVNLQKCERVDGVVVGVNIGKNKSSSDSDAVLEYGVGASHLGPLAHYLVVNVSSPNTPGLRHLQDPQHLKKIIKQTSDAINRLEPDLKKPKLLIKISPDLNASEKRAIASAIDGRVDGLILTNTTVSRPSDLIMEEGGLSGAPLKFKSTQTIRDFYSLTGGHIPIIGCGGISSGEDAYEKVRAGASLLQVYTVLVYEGLPAVSRINRELMECLKRDGFTCLAEAVGADHRVTQKPCCSLKTVAHKDNPSAWALVGAASFMLFSAVAHTIASSSG